MYLLKDKKAVLRFSFFILGLIVVASIIFVAGGVLAATHTSSASLEPEWSTPGVTNDYTVTITNNGPDTVDEIRIYKNDKYTDFVCKEKTGWEMNFIVSRQACHYIAESSSYHILANDSDTFEFSAKAPTEDPQECLLYWKFETRDVNEMWKTIYDTTSIDSHPPITTKIYGDPHYPININDPAPYPHYISTSTPITLTAVDMSEECGIGVDYIKWRNIVVPDIYCETEASGCSTYEVGDVQWNEEDGDEAIIYKKEESCHLLEFFAVDKLGNEEDHHRQCVFVDDTPPIVSKEIGEPKIPCEGEGSGEFFCEGTPGEGSCSDYSEQQCEAIDGCTWTINSAGTCVGTPILSCSELEEAWQGKCDETVGCSWREIPPEPECDYWLRDKTKLPGTPITLSCEDQGPHPVNEVEIYYKVLLDGQLLEDWTKYTNPIVFDEDSEHTLQYYCIDAVGNSDGTMKDPHEQIYRVDSLPPIIEKDMFGNYMGDCPSGTDIEHGNCSVADDGTSGVDITVYDDDTYPECAVDDLYCYYDLTWILPTGERILIEEHYEFSTQAKITFTEDSTHELYIYCEDALGNYVEDTEYFKVDSTPPVTTKTYGDPHYPDPIVEGQYPHWITSQTPITLTAEDEKSGVDKIYWRNTLLKEDKYCESYASGDCVDAIGIGDFVEYTAPFYKPEESCHLIEYYSVDKLGNTEETKRQCVYVENTAPTSDKVVGQPQVTVGNDLYITQQTPITLTCTDLGDHPVDQVSLWYRYRTSDDCQTWGEWTSWIDPIGEIKEIRFTEDSCHELEYYCEDALGNTEPVQREIDIVDTVAPRIEIEVVGPQVGEYIDGITEIHVNATDPEPHPVGGVQCEWGYNLDSGEWFGWYDTFPIIFPEETQHDLVIKCWDALGNGMDDSNWYRETFFVDKTPPETVKRYSGPQYSNGLSEYSPFSTSIDIEGSAYDLEVTVEDEGDWMVWTFDFPVEEFTGDGNLNVGLIIATDGEGNGPAFQIHNNDGTDSSFGWGDWLMSPWGPTIGDGWFGWHSGDTNTLVTSLSWVEATGNRNVPHNDGVMVIRIKKSELGTSFHWAASPTVGSGFYSASDVTMQIPTAFGWSTPLVDMGVPNYIYAESIDSGYPKWINFDTLIHLTPIDAGPHQTGINATYWRNSLVSDENCWDQEVCQQAVGDGDWNLYTEPFNKSEESCHLIEYYSVDNVNKTEEVNKQCVFVDNTPPTPLKEVGEPKTEWDGTDSVFYPDETAYCWATQNGIECWKVTLDTEINMSCVDPDPHPVDHENICFMVGLDADDATDVYCTTYGGTMEDGWCCLNQTIENFKFLESSEHNLKFYCEDALGNSNKENFDEEKFKVNGEDFRIKINKKWNLISTPFVLLNEDIEEVFEDIEEDIEAVWVYDPLGELCTPVDGWCVYSPGDAPSNLLNTMQPGWGYWVLALDNTELIIGGSLLAPGRTPPSRNLTPGWNLIGYYGTEGDDDGGYFGPVFGDGDEAYCSLYSLVNTNSFIPAKRWSSLYGYWETDFEGYGMCDKLDPGAGYWIHMPADLPEYYYAPATGCPTAFWDLICSVV